ncbi:hypothetical protein GUJ93_ZPchr0004g39155 [Zizania palustris]|uniref:PGG domain-containing protein n=1 Tax=Zizania palustris TaxID=103762 RepID=A0A8J5VYA5_ZIZPA|nr:hypothetical protein GUJ93_ZPchr0004g39155 [Zizania palustris]
MAPPLQDAITVGQFSDEAVDKLIARYREQVDVMGEHHHYHFRGWLMLVATLTASITYAAALNPPGGVWQADDVAKGYVAGYPVLRDKSAWRYFVFFYCNATAFASSLCIILLLAITKLFSATKIMAFNLLVAVDMISLAVAFVAGSSSSRRFTMFNALWMVCLTTLFLVWKRRCLLY